ncbi:MAG: response regulator [Rhodothermales bacterium]
MATLDVRKVLVVDDHPIVRLGLKELIDKEADLEVAAEAESAFEALGILERQYLDMAIVDLSLRGTSGIELTRQIKAEHPRLPVLMVSLHDEGMYAERALAAGAQGYIMKRESYEKLVEAIHHVLQGGTYLSETLRRQVDGLGDGGAGAPAKPISALTDREMEVFRLIGEGYAPRHIAEKLFVSVKTVETHRQRIRTKLALGNAAALRAFAVDWLASMKGS